MNIVKRGNSYRITVSLGTNNGKRSRVTKTFKTDPKKTAKQNEQDAIQFGIELENRLLRGGSVKYDKMTFDEFAELYFKKHASEVLKEYTAVQYRDIYEKRIKPYFGNMRIKNITGLDVISWLADLERSDNRNSNEGKLTANSKGVYFRTLSAMFGVAVRWEIIDDNPCRRVTMPKSKQTGVKALQKNDFDKLFEKLKTFKEDRAVILIYILVLTGIREGEAAGLKWQDVDFENRVIHIEREVIYIPKVGARVTPPKSANSNRNVFIPELLCDKLKAYKNIQDEEIKKRGDKYHDEGYIITQFNGSPVHASTIRKWIKKVFEECDVPYVTVHGLRHTYASMLIARGVDVRTTASQLGHSSPALTLNIYANPQNEAKRRAGDLIGLIANGEK